MKLVKTLNINDNFSKIIKPCLSTNTFYIEKLGFKKWGSTSIFLGNG